MHMYTNKTQEVAFSHRGELGVERVNSTSLWTGIYIHIFVCGICACTIVILSTSLVSQQLDIQIHDVTG